MPDNSHRWWTRAGRGWVTYALGDQVIRPADLDTCMFSSINTTRPLGIRGTGTWLARPLGCPAGVAYRP